MVNSLRKHIYDIKTILTKHGFSTDSRFYDNFFKYKILERREQFTNLHYMKTGIIYPELIEDYGIVSVEEVNAADDSSIEYCCAVIGKLDLPKMITMVDIRTGNSDLGLYIKTPCGTKQYNYTSLAKFHMLPKDHLTAKERRYIRIHDAIYVAPVAKQVRVLGILADPTEGYVNDNLSKANDALVVGTNYKVITAQILHDGIAYDIGDMFTATVTSYTGNGKVVLTNPRRLRTWDDEFPMPFLMSQEIILDLLTKEFGFELKIAADAIQDARDQSQLVTSNVN